MQSVRELYKIGRGPSSSHTLAPERACRLFVQEFGKEDSYEAELFGSLSLTGRGHNTDKVIMESLPSECHVIFSLTWNESFPNGFYLRSYDQNHVLQHQWTIFSLGGGSIKIKEKQLDWNDEVYIEKNYVEFRRAIDEKGIGIEEYEYEKEPLLKEHLHNVLNAMIECVKNGLSTEGILPGRLAMKRSAKELYESSLHCPEKERDRLKLIAYAYAAAEENAAGHMAVTAPTLGSCGVMASLMYYAENDLKLSEDELVDALAVGGLFGNLIKTNATISGAVGGCQAEIGAAVSMACASYAFLNHLNEDQIEYAAEIGMEHQLGLTCDPVEGYVMIPCIERNSMGVLRAVDAVLLSKYMSRIKHHLVSFDMVVETMKETGKQIPIALKETSKGGLAREFENEN